MAFFEFPHTRTYDSDLAWLIKAYKILTGKVNNIEQTIEDTINEALQGEELKQLITQLIAEALPLNVKYPHADSGLTPAVGDGETDDTVALQAMIAYANANNMPMLFPAGVYRVTGLNIDVDTVFQGFNATLMLAPVSAAPLITLTADLATSGLTLNGNLGGQTTPQNVINIVNGSFAITNTNIMGGESCIEGTLVGDSMIGDSYLRNFQEYGIHAEGSGSFVASNVVVPSVSSGGAMRFMRIDCDNCTVSNFSSKATVPIGFEITGDNNTITANIPNAETPVNDGGQNNNWNITGKSEKKYFNGNATTNADNIQETAEGDISRQASDFTDNGTNYTSNMAGVHEIQADTVFLNPTAPLKYGIAPSPQTSGWFDTIPMQDGEGNEYKVLVNNDKVDWLARGMVDIRLFGAVGDGVTNNDTAIKNAYNYALTNNMVLFIPEGNFLVSSTIDVSGTVAIIGTGKNSVITHRPTTAYPWINITIESEHCLLADFTLDSNASQQAIWIQGDYHTMTGMYIEYSGSGSAVTIMGNGHRIIRNYIHTINHTTSWAITLQSYAGDDGKHWSINVLIDENHINFGMGGIQVQKLDGNQVEGLTISNNTILGQGYGLTGDDVGYFGIGFYGVFVAYVIGNIIDQTRTGITIEGNVWANISITINSNYIGAKQVGVQVANNAHAAEYLTIDDCFILNVSGQGINTASGTNRMIVSNCRFQCTAPCLWIQGKNMLFTGNYLETTDSSYAYINGENNTGGLFIFENNFHAGGKNISVTGATLDTDYFVNDREER